MDRIVPRGGYSELIDAAYSHIPAGVRALLRPHFLTGTDPVFAGLHGYRDTNDGRSYLDIAHVAYEFHQPLPRARRRTTVVLPRLTSVRTIVHELGHVLDERLDFEYEAVPVTSYAETSHFEAFAEAFAAWALPFGHGYGAAKDRLYERDRATVGLFEALADRRTA